MVQTSSAGNTNTRIKVLNNAGKYYADLAQDSANEAALSATEASNSADDAENYKNSTYGYMERAETAASAATPILDDLENVLAVANDLTNIDSVANDLTNIDAVVENQTNIDTVADDLANINVVADNITNINAVNDNETNINSVANDLTNLDAIANDLTNIDNASSYATISKEYAIGVPQEPVEGSAKYWAERSAQSQIQSDWLQTDNTAKDYIKNKPTALSAFTDDLGTNPIHSHSQYLTQHQDISGKEDSSNKVTSWSSTPSDTKYPSEKLVYDTYSGYQTIQDIQTLVDGTITLNKTKSTYYRQPAADTTFTFSLASGTVTSSQSFTFELYVYMPTTAYSLVFPNTLTWQNGEAPDVTEVGLYRFAFQTLDAGTTWNGNLQGKW